MKILLTGANGLLGQHLVKLLLEKGYTVIATGKGLSRLPFDLSGQYRYYEADITDEMDMYAVMQNEKPDVVIHAAAMTQVDDCELHPEKCERVNVYGTANVAALAEEFARFLIYISTDFVFDGEQGDYREEDELKPVSWYGFTKMQAESIVQTSRIPWSIVRTCLVYGNILQGTRNNIISWVKQNLEQQKPIRVVSDQWRTPTYVEDLAKGILLIIEKQATGIYHLSGSEKMTPYDIALHTADKFRLDKGLIEKVDAANFTQPGRRPPKTGFVIEKAKRELGYEPLSFTEGVNRMFDAGG